VGGRQPPALTAVAEAAWQEACRRESVVRPLATGPRLSRHAVMEACAQLRLSKSQVYERLRRYRIDPRTTSLVRASGGMPKGADRLAPEMAAIIERLYLTRQKLSGAALFDAVQHECRAAGLKPPSLKAVRRRVAARPAVAVMRAREGAAAATQRFRPVLGSLKTAWPLDVLQMDHTPVDLIVVDEAARKPIGRPWLALALAMDVDTRMVAGFLMSLDPPCATSESHSWLIGDVSGGDRTPGRREGKGARCSLEGRSAALFRFKAPNFPDNWLRVSMGVGWSCFSGIGMMRTRSQIRCIS
jgi:putative transposase